MSMEYIRKTYNVPAKRGGRILYTGDKGEKRYGTIVGAIGQYLSIRLDGEKVPQYYHPTWELTYVNVVRQ